ncbi:MAG: beta-lactamase family protein [Cellulophaga sp.]|nr:beta-lactamase family protein [Cellulophaga sp.]
MNKLVLIFILALVSCKSPVDKKSVSNATELEQFEVTIDSILNDAFDANEPGVALLISYDGKMLIGKGFGLRNIETKEPITASTNMEMASVSKQFTALAILSLVDKGKLSLNDEVYKFFPYETFKDVTVKQLINHTSGIEDAEDVLIKDWDSTKVATNADILKWYSKKNRKNNNAGQVFQYNNGAYEILPLIVEKVSGEKYEDYIKENVFGKAGMKRTIAFNLNSPVAIDERAFYYTKDSLATWNKMDGHPFTGILGAGGIYTSVDDYFKYDNALRNNAIFTKETHNLIFEKNDSVKTDFPGESYAMGWNVNDSIAIHTGGWFGVKTITKRYLKIPLTIAVFGNRDDYSRALFPKIDSLSFQFVKDNYPE